jgi:hypothetical protein
MKINDFDQLVRLAAFGSDKEKNSAFLNLWQIGQDRGILPSSIHDLYVARGKEDLPTDFTVPALNLRGMAYDMAQAALAVAVDKNIGAIIFEIARSEIAYTNQAPREYTAVLIAAALKVGFTGPLFIQGDHFQVKVSDRPGIPKNNEVDNIKRLISQSIEAGFYNIDLDISTLVDYSKADLDSQQKNNYTLAVELTKHIRSIEPAGVTVSLGGEIGHIGGKNSTEDELHAYMKGYNSLLPKNMAGLSKMAIQTGTHHGGVPMPDGSLAKVDVDFDTLKKLSQTAREYHMGGAVQHGASTLPDSFFAQFPACEAIEVHLATGFQNIIMDHPKFPKKLLDKMYSWLDKNLQDEKKAEMTDEQFHYKLRKKAWGQFKRECWDLSEGIKASIRDDLSKRFEFMFAALGVENSKAMVEKTVKASKIEKKNLKSSTDFSRESSQGLAD